MADPWHHAVSAARTWGGTPESYLEVERWFDESKALMSDFRHRALRHHSEGIELATIIFGQAIPIRMGWDCLGCGRRIGPMGEQEAYDVDHHDEVCPDRHSIVERTRMIPVRWIGERHVREDMGKIPSAVDWLREIRPQAWMNRPRKLSRELEREQLSRELEREHEFFERLEHDGFHGADDRDDAERVA